MSDQVTITVHRRNEDGTWQPGEEPPPWREILVKIRTNPNNFEYQSQGIVRDHDFKSKGGVVSPAAFIVAWADVTDVFAGKREEKP